MQLKSIKYFQGKWSVDAYINDFEDLVDLAGYSDKIGVVIKFQWGLENSIQDKIAESGNDGQEMMI